MTLEDAINRLAAAIEGQGPSSGPPPAGSSGPPLGNQKSPTEKMSAKVYAVCKQNNWDIADIGQRVLGRPMGTNSRTWTVQELGAVLDAFKEWKVG